MGSFADPQALAVLVATIVAFTVLFDLVDLRPQVRSFGFIRTGTYAIYLLLRLFLALIAALVIAAAQPDQPPIMIGFIAVLGSVVVLQGLALRIAGEDVVNLSNLVQTYKDRMVQEESRRAALALQAAVLNVTNEVLARVDDVDELRRELQSILFQAMAETPAAEDPATRVKQLLDRIEQQSEGDQEFKRRIYAGQIAQANIDYARAILKRPRASGPSYPLPSP